jgi:hypothetical protein
MLIGSNRRRNPHHRMPLVSHYVRRCPKGGWVERGFTGHGSERVGFTGSGKLNIDMLRVSNFKFQVSNKEV